MYGSCLPARRRRGRFVVPLLALTVLISLLTGSLTLAGAGPAHADDPVECAPFTLAPFGDPGDAVARGTLAAGARTCRTVTAEAGRHQVSLADPRHEAWLDVRRADGTQVECTEPSRHVRWCDFPASGAYTVVVDNARGFDPTDFQLSVVPLAGSEGCAPAVGTSWDLPPATLRAVSPVQVDCLPFHGEPGERVTVYGDEVRQWITDETGTDICAREEGDQHGCVLPGDGPYRVLAYRFQGGGPPADERVQIRRLSAAEGCPALTPGAFGTVPAPGTLRCRSLTVPGAGRFLVDPLNPEQNETLWSYVYDGAGKRVCQAGGWCAFPAAGRYVLVVGDPDRVTDPEYATVFLDRTGTEGCRSVGWGRYEGEFGGAGEYECLLLPGGEGVRFAALTKLGGPGPRPAVEVVDAEGDTQCTDDALDAGTCEPKGTAPHRLLVHADSGTTGAYALDLIRTDAPEGCAELPSGSFTDDGAVATIRTGGGVFSRCLTVPAGTHTQSEVFQLIATSGGVAARFSVVDADGRKVCDRSATTDGWVLCALTPGKAHTVLVNGRDQAAAYTLARRDVTSSAASAGCVTSAATKVGGASRQGVYGVPGSLRCHRVTTGAATDVVHIDVRDKLGTGNIAVFGDDGGMECSFRNRPCAVSGSTSHQVLVQVPARLKTAPDYRLDTLRIATADGPAAECEKVPTVAYGYGPVTGRLDESRTAVCAVLPTAGFDTLDTEISDTTGATTTAVPALYTMSSWSNGCVNSSDGYRCNVDGSPGQSAPSLFLLGLPEKASTTSYRARLVCSLSMCGTDEVGVTSVGPDTGAAGGKVTLTVTGTALPSDTEVRLYEGGRTITAKTESVSADHRRLTATLDLTGVSPGTWSVSVIARGWEFPRGTFTVTRAQLRSTAPPKVTGTVAVGAKVRAAPGSWSAAPSSYTYQWHADGAAIKGATASAYTVPAALAGRKLTVTVTAARSGWDGGTATSAAVTVAKGAAPKAKKLPVISGKAKVGKTLTAGEGAWSPAAASYAYQWYASGKAIQGATASSLKLKTAQKGKKITVKVTARRPGHQDGAAVSKATGAVVR
ncbi:Tat pathway signal protein [Streptomyces ossamyceticus]|nr:Tat pathway signal protein [Streptomyces ossamyceticus]